MNAGSQGQQHADLALRRYDVPEGSRARLISLSENATYLVEADRPLGVLRVYRPGYQSDASKESELAWIEAIRTSGTVHTPAPLRTSDGAILFRVEAEGEERAVVMFEFIPGSELGDEDMETFTKVGVCAARLHTQTLGWTPPDWFDRPVWGVEDILGTEPRWGDWRSGPNITDAGRDVLEQCEVRLRSRLAGYPQIAGNSGLVHCDLRAANILADDAGELWVIDFDDCGFSWFLWDLCSTTTFLEHTPIVSDVVDAWLDGYLAVRELAAADLDLIPDLVTLRRMHLLAWLGTHPESDLAASLGDSYAEATVEVAAQYLSGRFLAGLKQR